MRVLRRRRMGPKPRTAPTGVETFHFRGYDISIDLLLKTGGGTDTFAAISEGHVRNLNSQFSLRPDLDVFEMGCGIGRDAIPLSEILTSGSYLGTDVIRPSVEWCQANISPPGTPASGSSTKTCPTRCTTRAAAGGITDPAAGRRPRLRPGFRAVGLHPPAADPVLLLPPRGGSDPASRRRRLPDRVPGRRGDPPPGPPGAHADAVRARLPHRAQRRVLGADQPGHPTGAVAYSEDFLHEKVAASGLRLRQPILNGGWSGYHPVALTGRTSSSSFPL